MRTNTPSFHLAKVLFVILLILSLCLSACSKKTAEVSSITLNKTTLTLDEGANENLTATIAPSNAEDKRLTWSSSDATIATVDASGKVTAIKEGAASITATATNGVKATCALTVRKPVFTVTGVSLNKSTLVLEIGDTETLTATVSPNNATNKVVSWASDNTDVATVSATGEVRAIAAGTTSLTVTTTDGNKTATCELLVVKALGKVSINDGAEQKFTTGSLSEKLSGSVTKIVFGDNAEINGSDIKAIMALSASLLYLDMTKATIVEGGDAYYSTLTTTRYEIGWGMFSNMSKLETVLLSANTTRLDTKAFAECAELTYYNIPEGVGIVGQAAFNEAKMSSVSLPASLHFLSYEEETFGSLVDNITVAEGSESFKSIDGVLYSKEGSVIIAFPRNRTLSYAVPEGVKQISYGCFDRSQLTSLSLPSSLNTIEGSSFNRTALTHLVIPANVNSIMNWTIVYNNSLETITVNASIPPEKQGNENILHGNDVLTAIYVPYASVAAYKTASAWSPYADIIKAIPETIPPGKVSINNGAEQDYIVGSLAAKLGGSVSKVVFGAEAPLNGTDIKALMALDKTLEYLDMSTATIVDGGEEYPGGFGTMHAKQQYEIGPHMFYEMPVLKTAILPVNTTNIGFYTFMLCPELSSYTIPEGVKSIGAGVFAEAKMETLTLPTSLSGVDFSGLTFGHVNNIHVAEANTTYSGIDGVLYSKDKKTLIRCPYLRTSYSVPEGVNTLGSSSFDQHSIASLHLPSSLTSMYGAIRSTNLVTLSIPANVNNMEYAITQNHLLETITMHAHTPPTGPNCVRDCPKLTAIYVPNTSVAAYKAAEGWSNHAAIIKPMSEMP